MAGRGQRAAELVAGIRHEPLLSVPCRLEAGQHLVQRAGQSCHLVAPSWRRDPVIEAARRRWPQPRGASVPPAAAARPVTNHVARPTTSTRKGTATASTAPTTWVVCCTSRQGSCNEHEVHLVGSGCRFGDQDEVVAQLDRKAVDDAHLAGLHRRDRRLTLDVRARRHDSSSLIEDLDQRLVDIVDGEPVDRCAGLHQRRHIDRPQVGGAPDAVHEPMIQSDDEEHRRTGEDYAATANVAASVVRSRTPIVRRTVGRSPPHVTRPPRRGSIRRLARCGWHSDRTARRSCAGGNARTPRRCSGHRRTRRPRRSRGCPAS